MKLAGRCAALSLKSVNLPRGFDMQIEFYIVVLIFVCMAIVVLDDIVSKG